MPLRPGRCYRYLDTPPYTRTEYIDGAPQPKITKFDMGSPGKQFSVQIDLVSEERGLIRHNALEAARVMANKYLSATIKDENYHLRVVKYPHHIIRENKMLAMAGADRLQEGMRRAFGKPTGRAAIVDVDDVIMTIWTEPQFIDAAKEAFRRAAAKIPMPCSIVIKNVKSTKNEKAS